MIDKVTVAKYRNVFQTPEGKEVFADILTELGFFKATIATDQEATLSNFSKLLLAKLGIWHENNAKALAESLINLPGHSQEVEEDQDE